MQQDVRESVAALLETAMAEHSDVITLTTIKAINTVLVSGGHTPKDVGDWLRKGQSVEVKSAEVGFSYKKSDGTKWRPSALAPIPSGFTEEEACKKGAEYLERHFAYPTFTMEEKEKDFVNSVYKRLAMQKRWLSVKQKRWLDEIARKYGVLTIA